MLNILIYSKMNKNLWIITASQIFSFTPAPVNIFLSGIIGSTLRDIRPNTIRIKNANHIAIFSFFAFYARSIR